MIVQGSATYLGILMVLLVSMRGQSSPVNSKKEGKSSYALYILSHTCESKASRGGGNLGEVSIALTP